MRIIALGILLSLTISHYPIKAQAYWVIETNLHRKNFTIIRFYNDRHALMHEIKREGVYFDPSKKRHKRKLDVMLKNYLLNSSTFFSKKERKQNVIHPY